MNWPFLPCGCLMVPYITLALIGAEAQVNDLRLLVELRPIRYTATWNDLLGSRTSEGSLVQAWAVGTGWRRGWGPVGRPWRMVAGVEAIALHEETTGTSNDGQVLRLEAGIGYAFNHHLTFAVLPVIGYGRATLEADPVAASALTLDGSVRELGVRASGRWNLSDRWSMTGEVGWLRADQRLSGSDARLDIHSSGVWAGLALSWTINPLPGTLE